MYLLGFPDDKASVIPQPWDVISTFNTTVSLLDALDWQFGSSENPYMYNLPLKILSGVYLTYILVLVHVTVTKITKKLHYITMPARDWYATQEHRGQWESSRMGVNGRYLQFRHLARSKYCAFIWRRSSFGPSSWVSSLCNKHRYSVSGTKGSKLYPWQLNSVVTSQEFWQDSRDVTFFDSSTWLNTVFVYSSYEQ